MISSRHQDDRGRSQLRSAPPRPTVPSPGRTGRGPRRCTSAVAAPSAPARRRAHRRRRRRAKRRAGPPRRGTAGTAPDRGGRAARRRSGRAAPVAEVTVGHTVEVVIGEQGVEVAQVAPEPLRGDGGLLPADVPGCPSVTVARPAPYSRIRHSAAISSTPTTTRTSRAGASRATASAAAPTLVSSAPVTSAKSQPLPRGRCGTHPPLARTTYTIRGSSPSQATRGVVQQPGHRVGGLRRRGWPRGT
jgi:hypothetical protein